MMAPEAPSKLVARRMRLASFARASDPGEATGGSESPRCAVRFDAMAVSEHTTALAPCHAERARDVRGRVEGGVSVRVQSAIPAHRCRKRILRTRFDRFARQIPLSLGGTIDAHPPIASCNAPIHEEKPP